MAQEQEYVRLRPEFESCGDGLVPLQPDVPKQKILVAKDLVTMFPPVPETMFSAA